MNEVPLGEVCDVVMGQAPAGTSYNEVGEGLPLLAGAGDFGEDFPQPKKFTTAPTKKAHAGDIILCIRATIGDLNLADREYCLGRGVAGLRPRNGRLDERYLWHWMSSHKVELAEKGKGSTFKQVSRADIQELKMIVPDSMEEQRRIAAILDKADCIRRKREQALALADDFLRSAFIDIFGDPAHNPRGFEVRPVEELLSENRAGVQSGPFGSGLKKHEYVDDGIPVWGIDNVQPNRFVPGTSLFITEEKYQQLKRYSVEDGDILISRAGTVGRMCIAHPEEPRSIISTNLVRVSLNPRRLLPDYFVCLFTYFPHRLSGLKTNQKENAFTFLNPKTLRALSIPVPPIEIQERFADIVDRREAMVAHIEADIDASSELFASLSQRAFKGEL